MIEVSKNQFSTLFVWNTVLSWEPQNDTHHSCDVVQLCSMLDMLSNEVLALAMKKYSCYMLRAASKTITLIIWILMTTVCDEIWIESV